MDIMRALQITTPGKSEIIESPIPDPGMDDLLVEIEAITTCPHWDRHIYEGRPMFPGMKLEYPYWPGQPGHEAIGRVKVVGSKSSEHLLGQRVAIWKDAGPYRRGMYATHGIVPVSDVLPVPEDLPAEKICSLELAMCVQVSIDQLSEINTIRERKVVVSGLGPAGLIAIQLLRHAGAGEIWAIDPMRERRKLAKAMGADFVVIPGDKTLPDNRETNSAFHAGLDTTGLPGSIQFLMKCSTRAVAIFGVLRDQVHFGPEQWYGGFSLIGYGEHNRPAADRALAAILSGNLNLSPLITHTLPLSQYSKAVALLQSMEAIKILLDPRG